MAGLQRSCLSLAPTTADLYRYDGFSGVPSAPALAVCHTSTNLRREYRRQHPRTVALARTGQPPERQRAGGDDSVHLPTLELGSTRRVSAAEAGFGAADSELFEVDFGAVRGAIPELSRGAGELGALSVDDYYFISHGKQTEPPGRIGAQGVRPDDETTLAPEYLKTSTQSGSFRRGTARSVPVPELRQNTATDRAARILPSGRSQPASQSGQKGPGDWRPADLGPRPGHDWPSAQAHIPREPQPIHSTGRLVVSSSSATVPPAERTFTTQIRQCMHMVQVGDLHMRTAKEMQKAVDSYTEALQLHLDAAATVLVKRAESYAKLAVDQQERGYHDHALASWEACISDAGAACELDPALELGYFYQGLALHNLGQAQRATAVFLRGLQVNPHHEQLKAGLRASQTEQVMLTDKWPGASARQ